VVREEAVKRGLITAATEMLREMNYKDISIREIARRAEVISVMIRYHFGSKEGLLVLISVLGI